MSSIAASHLICDVGAEPILQLSTRDRNRILLESELYGAHALGIRNVLFVTGDHTLLGTHPHAKMVYDLDSIQALQLASELMHGRDLAGKELDGTPSFYLGSTFNPYADPMELHAWRVEKKRDAGAQFFQTQAVYDVGRFRDFMAQIRGLGVYVLAGIYVLRGPKTARFMDERVPGIYIPEEIIERLEKAGEGLSGKEARARRREEGIAIALETTREVMRVPGVHGIDLMGTGWEPHITRFIESASGQQEG